MSLWSVYVILATHCSLWVLSQPLIRALAKHDMTLLMTINYRTQNVFTSQYKSDTKGHLLLSQQDQTCSLLNCQ